MILCRHKWEKLSETTTESVFESSMRAISEKMTGRVNLPHQLCDGDRKHIVILSCCNCGAIKKFVTEL